MTCMCGCDAGNWSLMEDFKVKGKGQNKGTCLSWNLSKMVFQKLCANENIEE